MKRLAWTVLWVLLAAPSTATAFMYEADPDFCCTPADELPDAYHDLLTCAEAGVSVCQVMLGDVWDGWTWGNEKSVTNFGESERWYGEAARQGHRLAIALYASRLCGINSVEPVHATERAIGALTWVGLFDDVDSEEAAVSERLRECESVEHAVQNEAATQILLLAKARDRRRELRSQLAAQMHGWVDQLKTTPFEAPGGWTTVPARDGTIHRLRFLEQPPHFKVVDTPTPATAGELRATFDRLGIPSGLVALTVRMFGMNEAARAQAYQREIERRGLR